MNEQYTVNHTRQKHSWYTIKIWNLLAITIARQDQTNLGNLRDGRRTAGQFRVRVRTGTRAVFGPI